MKRSFLKKFKPMPFCHFYIEEWNNGIMEYWNIGMME